MALIDPILIDRVGDTVLWAADNALLMPRAATQLRPGAPLTLAADVAWSETG